MARLSGCARKIAPASARGFVHDAADCAGRGYFPLQRHHLGRDHFMSDDRRVQTHPQAYQTAARWLGIAPENILMVACHNFDLNAAQDAGFKTAFVRRPDEWGPAGPPDPQPNRTYDYVCDDFDGLTAEVMDDN